MVNCPVVEGVSGAVIVTVYGKLLELVPNGPTMISVGEIVVTVAVLVTTTVQPGVMPVMLTETQSLPLPKLPVSRLTVLDITVGFVVTVMGVLRVEPWLTLMVLHVQAYAGTAVAPVAASMASNPRIA